MSTAEAGHPAWCSPEPCSVTDPTDDDACPGCGTTAGVQLQPAPVTVDAGTYTRGGIDWACTVINVLPTPQLRTAAFLTVLRAKVTRHSGKDPTP
ncbi:MAG: hypothetical protein ACRDQY_14825 [Pseudonocardiaceae bacterium]